MMGKRVLLTGACQYTEEQFQRIRDLGWEITYVKNELEPVGIPVDGFDAVVCNGLFLHNDIRSFRNLKLVQATSAGLDRLPVEYMEKHHIRCCNAQGVYSFPMAEWAVMSILQICKNAHCFFRKQQEHRWEKDRSLLELTDKKVCLIGYGDVGQETAKRLLGAIVPFLLTVIVCTMYQVAAVRQMRRKDPSKKGDAADLHFEKEWLESCDEAEQTIIYKTSYKTFVLMKTILRLRQRRGIRRQKTISLLL